MPTGSDDKPFATWCVMTHARPVLIDALREWGLQDIANAIEQAPSLAALRFVVRDADRHIRQHIVFGPLRRDLARAVNTLHIATTFAARGDAENTAAVVVGVFTHASSAQAWRRPWTRFTWRQQRAAVITRVQREQDDYRRGISR
ncbi:MAG: hypothetical protein IT324_33995 [Anaerolineae bacterium]|nr:hypothetical protein [Anaerolineae bacterium]